MAIGDEGQHVGHDRMGSRGAARGTNGNCTIPTSANGIAANGTAVSFLTIFPADATKPNVSTNDWGPVQAATPNKVDTKLSTDSKIKVYNDAGTVDLIIDVVGYYQPVARSESTPSDNPWFGVRRR